MPDSSPLPPALTLRPLIATPGVDTPAFALEAEGPLIAGRSSTADWTIPEQVISRRHAMFTRRGERWYVHDLQSRHGTSINGRRLGESEQVPLEPGDLLQFGPWSCRVSGGATSVIESRRGTTVIGDVSPGATVARVNAAGAGLGQRGLDALLHASQAFNDAADDDAVAHAVVEAVRTGTGCPRVVVTRPLGGDAYETLASSRPDEDVPLSRSLLAGAAAERGVVELRGNAGFDGGNQAHSVVSLGIRTAICAPILVGDGVEAFLYLDSRGGEASLPGDATAFCHAVVRLAGLALERRRGAELAARHARLSEDLGAAREAQQFLLPPPHGNFGPVRYSYECHAGRIVAGDLFDVLPLPGGRVAMFLGDVSGKGVGAGVLMAATQSQLRTHLRSGAALAAAVTEVNADLAARTASGTFVTLFAAVIDPAAASVEIVDAGHGYGVHVVPGARPAFIRGHEGFPLGVVGDAAYDSATLAFPAGARIITFSDGVVEQPDPAGVQFGDDAAIDLLAAITDPRTTATELLAAVAAHAQGDLADDFTVAAAWSDAG
jgi:serine phosphatase RsbU (regulator of sigma subunit)